eukprot:symbB.v1.2.016058.t1/scaffold1176.1/size133768/1
MPSTGWSRRLFAGSAAVVHGPPSMSRSSSRFIEDSGSLKVVHGPQQHFQQKVSEVAAMAGVKMLAAGFSWGDCEKTNGKLQRFTRLVIAFRKTNATEKNSSATRTFGGDICYVLPDHHATGQGYAGLPDAFNAGHEVRSCDLQESKPWYRIIDTKIGPPHDICENAASAIKISSHSYVQFATRQPYSCIVLKTFPDKQYIKEYAKSDADYGVHQDINRHMKDIFRRRMSSEFTSSLGPPMMEDLSSPQSNENMERVQSMARMRSLMSGSFLDAVEEGPAATPSAKEVSYGPPPPRE